MDGGGEREKRDREKKTMHDKKTLACEKDDGIRLIGHSHQKRKKIQKSTNGNKRNDLLGLASSFLAGSVDFGLETTMVKMPSAFLSTEAA